MPHCLIGLGSNVGDRPRSLDEAVSLLARRGDVCLIRRSAWIETLPAGGPPGQPRYLNGAILIETSLAPEGLLAVLQQVEAALGRHREQRWGPRTIDLDLLLYDQVVSASPSLVLPHPRMAWRRFVLEPAAEIAGPMLHPTIGWTVQRLLDHLNSSPWYVALTGSIGVGKTRLAEQVVGECGARPIAEQPNLAQLEDFYRNPAGHAWQMELEFLHQRAALLAADSPGWADRSSPVISDFWFDQSAAFARVWLRSEQWDAYRARWDLARQGVVRPRLVVVLEAPAPVLAQRIRQRGRPCERSLTQEQLDRIGQSILDQAAQPDVGPLLRLSSDDPLAARAEVLAALGAMK